MLNFRSVILWRWAKIFWIQFGLVGCGLRLSSAQPSTVRDRYAHPHSPPPKLDSDKFGDEAGDQTGGMIESCTRLQVFHYINRWFHVEWPSWQWPSFADCLQVLPYRFLWTTFVLKITLKFTSSAGEIREFSLDSFQCRNRSAPENPSKIRKVL